MIMNGGGGERDLFIVYILTNTIYIICRIALETGEEVIEVPRPKVRNCEERSDELGIRQLRS